MKHTFYLIILTIAAWLLMKIDNLVGLGMMKLAKYRIRCICEKYPVEIQMRDFPACVKYGGPWPQRTNSNSK